MYQWVKNHVIGCETPFCIDVSSLNQCLSLLVVIWEIPPSSGWPHIISLSGCRVVALGHLPHHSSAHCQHHSGLSTAPTLSNQTGSQEPQQHPRPSYNITTYSRYQCVWTWDLLNLAVFQHFIRKTCKDSECYCLVMSNSSTVFKLIRTT